MSSKIEELVEWVDVDTGYQCLAFKHKEMKHWCGYVRVPRSHPWNRVGYHNCPTNCEYSTKSHYCNHTPEHFIDVHGGLTFSGEPVPRKGSGEWWFGFDCAHYMDYVPGIDWSDRGPQGNQTYKDFDFVQEQCHRLAAQLKDMEENDG